MTSRFDYQARAERGTCPVCGRSIQLKKDGALRVHGREADVGQPFTNCHGTGQKPAES
jgi:hypothetical protein